MASFGEQIESSRQAHLNVRALEEQVRAQINEVFDAWERGDETAQSVRWRLENVVRNAYRSAAAVSVSHMIGESGIPGWQPVGVFSTSYLQGLLADTRRNLREYKASARTAKDRRRAVSRIEHSAGVGAMRGYTDATIVSANELRDFGFMVRKLWVANFVNNVPCEFCQALHGMEVPLNASFPTDANLLKVYGDLKGPPRHPRCKCRLVILLVRLENLFELLNVNAPPSGAATNTLTTSEIQSLPKGVFSHVTRGLRKIIGFLRGRSS